MANFWASQPNILMFKQLISGIVKDIPHPTVVSQLSMQGDEWASISLYKDNRTVLPELSSELDEADLRLVLWLCYDILQNLCSFVQLYNLLPHIMWALIGTYSIIYLFQPSIIDPLQFRYQLEDDCSVPVTGCKTLTKQWTVTCNWQVCSTHMFMPHSGLHPIVQVHEVARWCLHQSI